MLVAAPQISSSCIMCFCSLYGLTLLLSQVFALQDLLHLSLIMISDRVVGGLQDVVPHKVQERSRIEQGADCFPREICLCSSESYNLTYLLITRPFSLAFKPKDGRVASGRGGTSSNSLSEVCSAGNEELTSRLHLNQR